MATLRKEVVENWRMMLFSILGIYGILALLMIIGNLIFGADRTMPAYIMRYTIVYMVFTYASVIFASLAFSGIKDKAKRVEYLSLPSSTFEKFMANAEKRYPGKLCAYIGYKEELSHLVYAGSDFFLMPSRFEPCGLSQLIAMRYGSVPIVRETGGLQDTVTPYNRFPDEGDGFSFMNFDAWEMRDAMRLAMACYKDQEIMDGLIGRAMGKTIGYEKPAEEYARHYIWML